MSKDPKSPRTGNCPTCNALLNAFVTISLYSIEVEDGSIVYYDGGPQPESEADLLELCEADNTLIVCEAGHLLGADNPKTNPLQILSIIANWPANSNSDPDVMGEALDNITELARKAVPKAFTDAIVTVSKALRFKAGHGYNSTQTGDYYVFAGVRNGLYTFYRPFTGAGHRLTVDEATTCFDPNRSTRKAGDHDVRAAYKWHDSNVTI
jgi:hypothetical protein